MRSVFVAGASESSAPNAGCCSKYGLRTLLLLTILTTTFLGKDVFLLLPFRTCVHSAWYWMALGAFIQELIEPSNSSIHNHYCHTHYFPDEEMMALRNNLVKVTLITGTADSEPSQMAEPWALCSALPVWSRKGDSHLSHLVPS